MPTVAMNSLSSAQSTPVRERSQTYRSETSGSMAPSVSPIGRIAHSSSSTSTTSAAASSVPITVQSLLQTYASSADPQVAALDFAVSERNALSAQNAQLWKLMEKQRTGHSQLMKELDRVRGERELYRSRLQIMGENTDALLKAYKEKERRDGKEGSLKSNASHSHFKNSDSGSVNGHASSIADPRAHLVRAYSDDIPSQSARQQNNDNSTSWTGRPVGRERQGSQNSVTISPSQSSNTYLSVSQASSSTQLSISASDSTDTVPSLVSTARPTDVRKPYPLSLNPTRSSSLPPAASSPIESVPSTVHLESTAPPAIATAPASGTDKSWTAVPFSSRDPLPSAPILLTPATPATSASLQGQGTGYSTSSTVVEKTLQPHVVVQSASMFSSEGEQAARTTPGSSSADDSQAPRSHPLSRESRISLPEEAKRYFATIGESPLPSPQTSHAFPTRSSSASPDKLSPVVRQGRSESPLRTVQTLETNDYGTAPEQSAADRRAIHDVDSSEFLDLDPDDTDSVNDSIDDKGSGIESADRADYDNGQEGTEIGPNVSRRERKQAAAEDFPLPPATPPAHFNESFVQAQMQSELQPQYQTGSAQRAQMGTSPASISELSEGNEASSSYRENYDSTDSRGNVSQSRSQPSSQGHSGSTGDTLPTQSTPHFTYRALPLLPSDLPQTTIQVTQSSIRPNDRGKDVLSFIINVNPGGGKQSWNVEKLYSDVLTLDSRIRASVGKSMGKKLVTLPEGRLWKDHAPARVDQRKAALELYLRCLLALPIKNKDEIIAFFTSGITSEAQKPVARAGYKEGYLTKRGKNFGGWKTRYFVLQGPTLEYYESRGGTHLGSIVITNAQIGRQQRNTDKKEWDEDNEYRHAFLIIESKKGPGGSNARHVLCAESDKERDSWVEILVRYVSGRYNEDDTAQSGMEGRASTSSIATSEVQSIPIRRPRKEDIAKGPAVPISLLAPDASNAKLFQSAPLPVDEHGPSSPVLAVNPQFYADQLAQSAINDPPLSSSLPVSSPLLSEDSDILVSAGPRANSEMGHYPDLVDQRAVMPKSKIGVTSPDQRRKERRRSMNPLKTSPIPERVPSPEKETSLSTPRVDANGKIKISAPMNAAVLSDGHKFGGKEASTDSTTTSNERREKAKSRSFWGFGRQQQQQHAEKAEKPGNIPVHVPRAVFAVPLQDSLDVAEIASLPAVVFRCIQYLEAKRADQEEGIYRLSGSSAVIKALKDRFNNEGDVDLLGSDECWDLHAIAGVLKSFLRELPVSILTRELHLHFLSVIDFVDSEERIKELTRLIAHLPIANYSLLRALTAHLISIVQNHNVNKMTIRNVGIVFSPTLGIPAGVFSLMLGEFQRVFNIDGALEDEQTPDDEDNEAVEFSRRNSKRYSDAAADELLGLSGRALTTAEEGQSDEGEDLSVHDESENEGADQTENNSVAESSATHGSAYPPYQVNRPDHLHPTDDSSARSRASNLAASRGLNIAVTDKASRRHSRMIGLPHSPRPAHAASPHSPHTPQKATPSPSLPPASPHTPI